MPGRLVLIPTYNERGNIRPLLAALGDATGFDGYSILFIDDSSPDNTAEEIEQAARELPGIHLLRRPAKQGLGAAYLAGFRWLMDNRSDEGPWERVFMMDADLSHSPSSLPEIDACLDGHDFVVGSRYVRGVSVLNWSILRLNLSYLANAYIRLLTGMPFNDCTSGFRGMRIELVSELLFLRMRSSGYAFLVEMLFTLWSSGHSIGEVPIVFEERREGHSKVSYPVFVESLLLPPRLGLGRLLGRSGGRRARNRSGDQTAP